MPHCISVTCNRLSLALVRNSKLLASQARKWTASFKDSELYEEELLAVSILMKSNCHIDIEPMVYLGSPFPIVQIITLTLHWWPKVSVVNYFRSMVAKFREKGQNLEVSLLSFFTYTFNLLFCKLLAENLILKLLQRRNETLILRQLSWNLEELKQLHHKISNTELNNIVSLNEPSDTFSFPINFVVQSQVSLLCNK